MNTDTVGLWPEPREDPEEEPAEPWARFLQEKVEEWEGWGEWRHRKREEAYGADA